MHINYFKIALRFLYFIIYFKTLFFFPQVENVTANDDNYKVGLFNRSFIPENRERGTDINLQGDTFKGNYFRLVQFYELPSDEDRILWKQAGFILTDYLPGNVYFAIISPTFNLNLIEQNIRSIFEVDKRFKRVGELFELKFESNNFSKEQELEFTIGYYSSLVAEDIIKDLTFIGVKVIDLRPHAFQLDVKFKFEMLDMVEALQYIQYIELKPEDPVLEWPWMQGSDRANAINVSDYYGANYNGDGITLAIAEGGNIGSSIDFRGRLNNDSDDGISGHKQGVAFRAANAGNYDPYTRMGAWGSRILNDNIDVNYHYYNTERLRFTNHSYGWSVWGGYSSQTRQHDLAIESFPKHMVLFSSGNSGSSIGYAPYNYQWAANITGAPKMSKNNFSIGVVDENGWVRYYSSRGPTYDGRIIPQVVTVASDGTSYAVPKATGYMAILGQVFKAKNANLEADSNLLGAILMNTADDVENPGPDFLSGYGRVNLRRAYNVINSNQLITSSISHNQQNMHTIFVPVNTKQIRVMLLWPDKTASVNANPAIVNNLNLQGISPSITTYNPWVLNTSLGANNLFNFATRQVDNINTFEQVTVDNPEQGNWTFKVSGAHIPFGPQKYFIVYEFLKDEVFMTYPLKDEKLVPGTTYPIFWDSFGVSGVFSLAYQLDSGNWTTIATNIPSNLRRYNWTAPAVTGVKTIKFKIQRGSLISISDSNTIANVPQNLVISQSCNNSVKLTWSAVPGATQYNVYRLGVKYMELVTDNITFYGTSAILREQNSNSDEYYAVSAITYGVEGQRTIAVKRSVSSIQINPILTNVSITSSSDINEICSGESITFTAIPLNGGLAPIYQWRKNGINLGTNTNTYSYVPTNGDIITCVLNSSDVCVTDSPKVSNSLNLVVNTTAMPIAFPQRLCYGSKVSDLVVTGLNIKWYNFAHGGTILSPETILNTGDYFVSQTLNGCESFRKLVSVEINDFDSPSPSLISLPTISGQCSVTVNTIPTAYDSCSGMIQATTTSALDYDTLGTHQIIWSYDDGYGNIATQNQMVEVVDTLPAVPTLPELTSIFIQCNEVINTIPTAYDSCSGMIQASTTSALDYDTLGAHQIVWSYDDGHGNIATQNQMVEVVDTAPAVPTLPALPTIIAQCNVTVNTIPTAFDACNGLIRATTVSPLNYSSLGSYTILWQYNDGNGNMATQTQVVEVVDTMPAVPALSVLSTIFIQCNETVNAIPTAFDVCSGLIRATTVSPLNYSTLGSYTILWQYDDGNGNITTQTQMVEVIDTMLAVPTLPTLPTIIGQCNVTVNTIPTALDACSGMIQATTTSPLNYSTLGSYTILWQYNDGNGNIVTQTQVVEVVDTIPAVPTLPALPTIIGQCNVRVNTIPTALDACNGMIQATTTSPLNYSTLGSYTILWKYNDGNGNIATQNQIVVVVDTAPAIPTLPVLPTITGQCNLTVNSIPTAIDACSGMIQATTTSSLNYSTLGSYTILWQYSDGNGNITTQTQMVDIIDSEDPICNTKDIFVYLGDSGTVTIQPSDLNDNSFDNCSIVQMTVSPNTFTMQNLGFNDVVLSVFDSNGNSATCRSNVHVLNNYLVYPNPFDSFILIEGLKSSNKVMISLFDISGRQIFYSDFENHGTVLRIDQFDSFASGIYILKIRENDKINSFRLIKK